MKQSIPQSHDLKRALDWNAKDEKAGRITRMAYEERRDTLRRAVRECDELITVVRRLLECVVPNDTPFSRSNCAIDAAEVLLRSAEERTQKARTK